MQFQPLFVALCLATSVAAERHNSNSTEAPSEKQQCNQISKLNKLVELASNTTKLDMITKGNATKIAEIQAKATTASTKLTTLQANTTLMSACTVIDAQEMEEDQCQETFMLQRFVAFANNSTAVATLTDNNATKAAIIQSKAAKATTKLATLTSNSTLQAACPAVMQKDECKALNRMQKFINFASNQTKLAMVTNGNTTKEAKITDIAAKIQTKLTAMEGNATFMAACAALNSTEKGTATGTNAATATGTTAASAAGRTESVGAGFVMLSTMAVVFLGMLTL